MIGLGCHLLHIVYPKIIIVYKIRCMVLHNPTNLPILYNTIKYGAIVSE